METLEQHPLVEHVSLLPVDNSEPAVLKMLPEVTKDTKEENGRTAVQRVCLVHNLKVDSVAALQVA